MSESASPPSPPQQPYPMHGQHPPEPARNSLGTAGFVFSILGFLTCGLLSPVALILSAFGMRREPRTLAIIGLVFGAVGSLMLLVLPIMVAIAVPSFLRAQGISHRNTCQENLAKLDGAKQQWALESAASHDAVPDWSDLIGEDKFIRQSPVCPSGGVYTINTVEEYPSCTLSAQTPFPHTFPQP